MFKKRLLQLFLVNLSIIFLFSIYVYADVIKLKNGGSINGIIVDESDSSVVVDIGGGQVSIKRADINGIEKSQIPETPKNQILTQQTLATKGRSSKEAIAPYVNKLPFSTAIITYKVGGDIYNGDEVAYIDASKNKVSKDTNITGKVNGVNIKIHKRDISDGKIVYHIDFDQKAAPSFTAEGGDAISQIFNEEAYLKYYKEQKSFLGKDCKVYTAPNQDLYFWNGMLLKENTKNPYGDKLNIVREAVDIKLDTPVSEDKFAVPDGIRVMTPEETMEDMGKMLGAIKGMKKEDFKNMEEDLKKIGKKTK